MLIIDFVIRNVVERMERRHSGLVDEAGSSLAAIHWTDASTRHSDYSCFDMCNKGVPCAML